MDLVWDSGKLRHFEVNFISINFYIDLYRYICTHHATAGSIMPQRDSSCTPKSSNHDFDLTIDEVRSKKLLKQLKAVAHPVRLRMVELLRHQGGEICVCEYERYFDLKQPTISHHLKLLRDAGLVESRNVGTWVHHSIKSDNFITLSAWIGDLAVGLDK